MRSALIILLTPFQLRQLALVAKQYDWNLKGALFLVAEMISIESIESQLGLSDIKCCFIPPHDISLPRMLKNPFVEIPRHRKEIRKLKKFLSECWPDDLPENLVIGSDKDVLTQLVFQKIKGSQTRVIAIDEGLGYYKEPSLKDRFFKALYPIASPMLFGTSLRYIATLGKHDAIEEVYARFPEDIPDKQSEKTFYPITIARREINGLTSGSILLLTSPLHEDHHCSLTEEQLLLKKIAAHLPQESKVDVKPHPREVVSKFDAIFDDRFTLLDSKNSAEELDYGKYKTIVHFGSSVILDIYQSGYPLDRVVALDMAYAKNKLTQRLFAMGKYGRLFDSGLEDQLHNLLAHD